MEVFSREHYFLRINRNQGLTRMYVLYNVCKAGHKKMCSLDLRLASKLATSKKLHVLPWYRFDALL